MSHEPTTQHELTGWPQSSDFRRSLRLEFALFASGLFLALMIASGYVMTVRSVESATRAVVETLVVQARAFSGPAGKHIIAADGPDALLLNDICQKLAADNTDVYWVGIAGVDDVLLAHTDVRRVVADGTLDWRTESDSNDVLRAGESFAVRRDTVFIATPILENGMLIGHLGLAASDRQIAAARRASIVTTVTITAFIIILGIPLVVFMLQRKLRPVTIITDRLQQIDPEHLELDFPIRSRNEFGYLAETLREMGRRLEEAQKIVAERHRIDYELDIAREIQKSMLPREFPSTRRYDFAGAYRSALEVGGDYYDILPFGGDRLGMLVADVSGKSLPGMLVMLMTRDIIKSVARDHQDPARLLCEVNRELLAGIRKDMFVTMFFGILDTGTGEFTFASAGHNPLIRLNAAGGTSQLIRPKGYPLGMMPPSVFDPRIQKLKLRLEPGDWIIQYTDGVNEALNTVQEEFGLERFTELLRRSNGHDARNLVDTVLREHTAFVGDAPAYDDITILAMKWLGVTVDNSSKPVEKVLGAR